MMGNLFSYHHHHHHHRHHHYHRHHHHYHHHHLCGYYLHKSTVVFHVTFSSGRMKSTTKCTIFNPLTLNVPLASIVCYFHTFDFNFGMERKFTKYLKERCCLPSDKHFSFKVFPKKSFVRKILSKSSGQFWPS